MKRKLSFITVIAALVVLMTACNTNPIGINKPANSDTTGFAQFKAWQAITNEQKVPGQVYVAAKKSGGKTSAKNVSMNSSTTNEAKVAKKKGWSKAAKYSAIGGGAGILTGAIINKRNRVAGGAIGGVLLGGVGYLFGRHQDKKDGRY